MVKAHASQLFLLDYINKHNIDSISDLFSKDVLIDNIFSGGWEWSIEDELSCDCGCTEEEARKRTENWFRSMTNQEIWMNHISDLGKNALMEEKAEELGFEFEPEEEIEH